MDSQQSLKTLMQLQLGDKLQHERTLTSSVTTAWGVNWDEEMIARDILQNFFDANRDRLTDVKVAVHEADVMISAPAIFDLIRLFYLGSEKGNDDIGQYGEGFKAAVLCLLRDHHVEPIVMSQNSVVYLRISQEPVAKTQLKPILYDFFRSTTSLAGTRLILRGCSPKLRAALAMGLDHFFHAQNTLMGPRLWASRDDLFAIFRSTHPDGHVFYRNLRRGQIPGIPVILVINKEYAAIEKKINHDRDRNAFGEAVMQNFYRIFARSGVRYDVSGQRAIVEAARGCWERGHPLLSAIGESGHWNSSSWQPAQTKAVFGDGYYARSRTRADADLLRYEAIERRWRQEGRVALPQYFEGFGVISARQHVKDVEAKALKEAKNRQSRRPSPAEMKAIDLLKDVTKDLAPEMAVALERGKATYCVAETEALLGELKKNRPWRSYEVFLAASVFETDFPEALAILLHEHAHIFGYDGSRGFSDALTDLLATVIRSRRQLDAYEARWNQARAEVRDERHLRKDQGSDQMNDLLDGKSDAEVRQILARVPQAVLRQILHQNAGDDGDL